MKNSEITENYLNPLRNRRKEKKKWERKVKYGKVRQSIKRYQKVKRSQKHRKVRDKAPKSTISTEKHLKVLKNILKTLKHMRNS